MPIHDTSVSNSDVDVAIHSNAYLRVILGMPFVIALFTDISTEYEGIMSIALGIVGFERVNPLNLTVSVVLY